MKQIKILGVLAVALTLGLSACNNGGGKSSVEECKKHTWGEYTTVKAATCTEDGSQKRVCSVCGKEETKVIKAGHTWGEYVTKTDSTCTAEGVKERECSVCHTKETATIAKKDHELIADDSKQDVAPTCEEDGTKYLKCKNCTYTTEEVDPKLGHLYAQDAQGNDIVEWSKPVTCTEDGVGSKTCTREGCGHVEPVTQAALGHKFELVGDDTEPEAGKAKVRVYTCANGCGATSLGFKANEVSEASKSHLNFDQPNEKGEIGASFWGRPIGNALALDASGTSINQQNNECVYSSTETGDFFEYVFDLTKEQADELATCRCYVDAKPANYLNGGDFFAYNASSDDWTPGYYIDGADEHVQHNDDGSVKMGTDHAPAPKTAQGETGVAGEALETEVALGARITDYRYILYVDDQVQAFDDTIKNPTSGRDTNMTRAEFVIPFTFHLHQGENKISLRMAGGYRSTFYNFTFRPYEEQAPAHVHSWVDDSPVAGGEGKVGYKQAHCSEDTAKRLQIETLDANKVFAEGSANKDGTPEPFLKLGGDGQSVTYTFNYAGAETAAKLNFVACMDGWGSSSNQNAGFYNGDSARMEITVNGSVVDMSALKGQSYSVLFAAGATNELGSGYSKIGEVEMGAMTLKNGENTITIKRLVTLNPLVSLINIVY